jgi:HPt (histidine-containing phosphotransfer) domain-containing protein
MNKDSKPRISAEAVVLYISRRRDDVENGRRYLESRDWESLAMIGHRLMGSGKTFGFPDLGPLGDELERAALEQNTSVCQSSLAQLYEWLLAKV